MPAGIATIATIEVAVVQPPGAMAALACELGACVALVGRRHRPLLAGLVTAVLAVPRRGSVPS